jgi:hypothetical protein
MSSPHVCYFYDADVGNFHYGTFMNRFPTLHLYVFALYSVASLWTDRATGGDGGNYHRLYTYCHACSSCLLHCMHVHRGGSPDEAAPVGIDTQPGAQLWIVQKNGGSSVHCLGLFALPFSLPRHVHVDRSTVQLQPAGCQIGTSFLCVWPSCAVAPASVSPSFTRPSRPQFSPQAASVPTPVFVPLVRFVLTLSVR